MNQTEISCPKCNGSMIQGVVLDPGTLYEVLDENRGNLWIEGNPNKSVLTGFKKSIKGKLQFPVKTFRCDDCGYLESYAV